MNPLKMIWFCYNMDFPWTPARVYSGRVINGLKCTISKTNVILAIAYIVNIPRYQLSISICNFEVLGCAGRVTSAAVVWCRTHAYDWLAAHSAASRSSVSRLVRVQYSNKTPEEVTKNNKIGLLSSSWYARCPLQDKDRAIAVHAWKSRADSGCGLTASPAFQLK